MAASSALRKTTTFYEVPITDPYEGIKAEVRVYLGVFAALIALTLLTVGVASLHLAEPYSAILAVAIAVIKTSLIACFFMHLFYENRFLFKILLLPVVLVMALLFLTESTQIGTQDVIRAERGFVDYSGLRNF